MPAMALSCKRVKLKFLFFLFSLEKLSIAKPLNVSPIPGTDIIDEPAMQGTGSENDSGIESRDYRGQLVQLVKYYINRSIATKINLQHIAHMSCGIRWTQTIDIEITKFAHVPLCNYNGFVAPFIIINHYEVVRYTVGGYHNRTTSCRRHGPSLDGLPARIRNAKVNLRFICNRKCLRSSEHNRKYCDERCWNCDAEHHQEYLIRHSSATLAATAERWRVPEV